MKFVSALIIFAVVAACCCVPIYTASPTPQQIKELKEAALLYLQSALPKSGSEPLPDETKPQIIPGTDTNYTISVMNGTAHGLNHFLFDQYEFNASTSSIRFHLIFPNLTKVYNSYEMEGVIFGHNVFGEGVMRQEVIGNGLHVTDLRLEEVNNSLQIASLELTVVLDKYIFEFGGLNVVGITVQQLEKLMEEYDMAVFNGVHEQVSKYIADSIKSSLNTKMAGLTTEQVIQWLKDHTKGDAHVGFIENFFARFSKAL